LARRVSAASVRPPEQLDAGYVLKELIEFVTRRLLDLSPRDSVYGVHSLGPRFRQGLSRDDDSRWGGRKRVSQITYLLMAFPGRETMCRHCPKDSIASRRFPARREALKAKANRS